MGGGEREINRWMDEDRSRFDTIDVVLAIYIYIYNTCEGVAAVIK